VTGADLAQVRARTGLSQSDFGCLLGMTQPEVARLESGERRLTHKHAAQLRCLGVVIAHGLLGELQGGGEGMTDTQILDWIGAYLLSIAVGPDGERDVEITWLTDPDLERRTTQGRDLRAAVRAAALGVHS
jgi:transcriptional regulator with XRE-family HTH domain